MSATCVRRATGLLLVTLILLAASAADAAGRARYSGTVVAIDPQRRVMVIEEMGPGREKPVVTRRTISLTGGTRFRSFIRVNVPDAFAGDFIEVALDADDVTPGDFVTVECVLDRGRLVASRVTLAELVDLPSSSGTYRP
jgi:hypothetical protein